MLVLQMMTSTYCGGKGHLIPAFLKYLDGQTIGQCMASAPPVNGGLLVRGNVESELEETLRTHLILTSQLKAIFLDAFFPL